VSHICPLLPGLGLIVFLWNCGRLLLENIISTGAIALWHPVKLGGQIYPRISVCWIILVRYHEDLCSKNKRMFRISTLGLFLICTERSLLFEYTHVFKRPHFTHWLKIRNPLTWDGSPSFMVANVPSTQVLCSKSTALRPLRFPSPPVLATRTQSIHLTYKDDINKTDSSVGHNTYDTTASKIWSLVFFRMVGVWIKKSSIVPRSPLLAFENCA
jgi:hypothetical protein